MRESSDENHSNLIEYSRWNGEVLVPIRDPDALMVTAEKLKTDKTYDFEVSPIKEGFIGTQAYKEPFAFKDHQNKILQDV